MRGRAGGPRRGEEQAARVRGRAVGGGWAGWSRGFRYTDQAVWGGVEGLRVAVVGQWRSVVDGLMGGVVSAAAAGGESAIDEAWASRGLG